MDHSAHALHSEVQKLVTINAWLRARDYPSMPLPASRLLADDDAGLRRLMKRGLGVWFLVGDSRR